MQVRGGGGDRRSEREDLGAAQFTHADVVEPGLVSGAGVVDQDARAEAEAERCAHADDRKVVLQNYDYDSARAPVDQGAGSRGSPSRRSPMIERWIWAVPP